MIYLSQIKINPMLPQRRWLLVDCYELHRSVMSAFPDTDGKARQNFNVLFYLLEEDTKANLIVQSDIEPDWEHSSLKPRNDTESIHIKEVTRVFENAVKNDKTFAFKLTACPSKKVFAGGKNSKRIFIADEEEQIAWLIRKGEQYGFEVNPSSAITCKPNIRSSLKKEIFFRNVEFSGRLRVTERDQFLKAIIQGIGSEKAFGCGLLMLSKPT